MENNGKKSKKFDVRRLVFTALMGALSIVLAEVPKFSVPMMPSYIKFEFSDVPAMLAALTMGPVSGVFVVLLKNFWGLFTTSTAGVGELSDFILSTALVLPAGFIAHKTPKISRAVIGCLSGAVLMALVSFPSNYFIVYPAYMKAMSLDTIIGNYQDKLPGVSGLAQCLVIFNMPFTFVKGLVAAIVAVVLYKKLRPIFNGMYRPQGGESTKSAV